MPSHPLIGVLAFQGDVREHHEVLRSLNVTSMDVRSREDLQQVHALIIPGGESTVLSKFFSATGMDQAIIERSRCEAFPIYGTCAGAILLSEEIVEEDIVQPLKLIDIAVERNSYGRQAESFERRISVALDGSMREINAVFIRAPRIVRAGRGVTVLATCDGDPVLCRQGSVLVSTFHPELLAGDQSLHQMFVEMCNRQ